MQSIRIFVLIIAFCSDGFTAYPTKIKLNLNQYLLSRCSLDPKEQTMITWKGSIYIHSYQTQPKHLFNIVGLNVARCLSNSKSKQIVLTTREIQLYLDPKTGQKLKTWLNPFTGQNVTVMHVANDPVQMNFSSNDYFADSYLTGSNQVVIPVDVDLFYPNPLYPNTTLRTYSKEPFYHASEFFKFFIPLDQIVEKKSKQVSQLNAAWTRTSPVLPWMNMSMQSNAMLVYSAYGSKVKNINQIDRVLLNEINNRVPIYRDAPTCHLNTSSETSWTYFKKYFAQYLSKTKEFPIRKSKEDASCIHD